MPTLGDPAANESQEVGRDPLGIGTVRSELSVFIRIVGGRFAILMISTGRKRQRRNRVLEG